MNKKQIVNKLKVDLQNAKSLMEIMNDCDIKIRLDAQRGYILNLLEWIEQDAKV